jgi:Leucine-rich repeat (LRR) protein
MSFNELEGRISVELAPLASLEVLDLSYNRFTGSFEEITHQLTSLSKNCCAY